MLLAAATVAIAMRDAAARPVGDPAERTMHRPAQAHGRKAAQGRPHGRTAVRPTAGKPAARTPLPHDANSKAAPLPRPKPPPARPAATGAQVGASARPDACARPNPEQDCAADAPACEARLKQDGVGFEPLPPLSGPSGCGAAAPLRVFSLAPGVAVPNPTLTCVMAEALAKWMAEAVIPAAEAQLGTKPVALLTGTSYECRPRNHQTGAKLSEHGRANAVDVAGFRLADKRVVDLADHPAPDSPEERFLAEIRAKACTYFHTVLGPGSDAAHVNHLHLDMAPRHHDFRICQ